MTQAGPLEPNREDMDIVDHAGLDTEPQIRQIKDWRKRIDLIIREIRDRTVLRDDEAGNAIIRLEESRMWLGMKIKCLNDGVSYYKHGDDVESAKAEHPERA